MDAPAVLEVGVATGSLVVLPVGARLREPLAAAEVLEPRAVAPVVHKRDKPFWGKRDGRRRG